MLLLVVHILLISDALWNNFFLILKKLKINILAFYAWLLWTILVGFAWAFIGAAFMFLGLI